jgi:iron complex transport system substrate-binding protein
MGKSIFWITGLCLVAGLLVAPPAFARSITDATGRAVALPDKIERVLPAGQPAAALVYMLAPERLLGWPRKPRGPGEAFLLPAVRDLPEIGLLVRDGKVNGEAVRELKPDLILDYGALAPDFVEAAKRAQQESGIPYVIFDGALEDTPQMLRLLASALGVAPRGEALAAAAERFLAITRERAGARRGAHPWRVYYSRSDDGLSTATSRAHSTDVLRLLGLENVADGKAGALAKLTREELMAARPEIVFAPNRDYIKAFATPDFAELPAVAEHRVYAAPRPPFGWIDEPPSANRLLGLLWAGKLLYPDLYPEDLRQEARNFYRLFYQLEPSDAQLDKLLQ